MDYFTKQQIEGMKHLQHVGVIENPDIICDYKSTFCGDRAKVYIKTQNEIIVDMKYEHLGCSLNCLVFETIIKNSIGKSLSYLQSITTEDITNTLIVPNSRNHCLQLALDTLSKGLNNCSY